MKRRINLSLTFITLFSLLSLVFSSCYTPTPTPGDDDEVIGGIDDFDSLTIDDIEEILKSQIPEVVTGNIRLTHYVDNSSARISWSSSPNLISHEGFVRKTVGNTDVILTATVLLKGEEYRIDIPVTVKGFEMKPLKSSRLITAYFYDYKYFDVPDEMLEQLDYIHYSFARIDVDTHKLILPLANINKVLAFREKGVRVGLAIGGWGADGFSQGVATPESRSILVASIMETLEKYQFDGIDLDWEYPTKGFEGMAYSPNDKYNLTLFTKELYQAMKAYRSDLLLTIAVISSSNSFYDLKGMEPYIDFFNLMTYDGGSGTVANHHTSLYNNVSNSVNFYLSQGIPSNKLIIGGAFYGHKKTITNLRDGILNSDTTASGTVDYTTMLNTYFKDPKFIEYFDDIAKAPYLSDGVTFISYDNPKSLELKAKYSIERNLGGMMFWELGSDKTGTLLNAIYQAMK